VSHSSAAQICRSSSTEGRRRRFAASQTTPTAAGAPRGDNTLFEGNQEKQFEEETQQFGKEGK